METFEELLRAWCEAERRGDAAALTPLLAEEFRGDGPLGYVLDKDGWLDRYRMGEVVVESFSWEPAAVRRVNRTVVAVGTQYQVARYRGEERSDAFPCTLVAVRREAGWLMVNLQLGQPLGRKSSTWAMFRAGCGETLAAEGSRDGRHSKTEHTQPHKGDTVVTATEVRQAEQAEQVEAQPAQQGLPQPDAALRKLDRFVGTWEMRGRTLGSEAENVTGRTTFKWLPGGYFLEQRISLNFAGFEVEGLELIGYDPATGSFPSTVYPNMAGMAIPYRWEVDGDALTITTDLLGAIFQGAWSEDGSSFSGGWRPMPGREGPGNVAYDVWGGRAQS